MIPQTVFSRRRYHPIVKLKNTLLFPYLVRNDIGHIRLAAIVANVAPNEGETPETQRLWCA